MCAWSFCVVSEKLLMYIAVRRHPKAAYVRTILSRTLQRKCICAHLLPVLPPMGLQMYTVVRRHQKGGICTHLPSRRLPRSCICARILPCRLQRVHMHTESGVAN